MTDADRNIIANLRFRWPRAAELDDQVLLRTYDEFSGSKDFGNNDERFGEWLEDAIAEKE